MHEWTQKWRQLLEWTHCVNLAVVRLSASRCIWANRRPGKVRNAPIREQSRARISLKVSLDMGPLWKRKHIVRFYCSFVSHKEFMKAVKTKMILWEYWFRTYWDSKPWFSRKCRALSEKFAKPRNEEMFDSGSITGAESYKMWLLLAGSFARRAWWSTHPSQDQTPGSFRWRWEWPWLWQKRRKQK